MRSKLGADFARLFREFEDNDPALEWCEDRLLETLLPARDTDHTVTAAGYELAAGMSDAEVATLAGLLQRRSYRPGDVLIQAGDAARELFFLARGSVSVHLALASGATRRLATFSPGMAFGEMAVLDRAPRSAMIVADTAVECDLLSLADFDALGETHPGIKIKLLKNLSLGLCSAA